MTATRVFLAAMTAGAIIIAGVGCAENVQRQSQLDRNWGRSFETAKYNQMLNPDAGDNLAPVDGLDGRVTEEMMKAYPMGDKQPQQSANSEISILKLK